METLSVTVLRLVAGARDLPCSIKPAPKLPGDEITNLTTRPHEMYHGGNLFYGWLGRPPDEDAQKTMAAGLEAIFRVPSR